MTLPTSGPLTFSDIQTEFGGTNPIALGEYYAGGGLVPAGTSGTYGAVPSSGALSIQNFYGTSNYIPVYVEELFSTWLFNTSTPSNVTIPNGINLSGNGGLVWNKLRSTDASHQLYDTVRGGENQLQSNTSNAQSSSPTNAVQFESNGFTWLRSGGWDTNTAVSWTFRKQPKFFDVVTYTGVSGANPQNISHNLGATPGFIIIKRYSDAGDNWICYHTSLGNTQGIILNSTGTPITSSGLWNNTSPTSTQFTIGTSSAVNGTGSFIAYLFAHNAGGFGPTGVDNIISCGSFTASGGNATIDLGYEPQWVMFKSSSTASSGNWYMVDIMRGWIANDPGNNSNRNLYANLTDAEDGGAPVALNSTGFTFSSSFGPWASATFIYIVVRRGPMKVPTLGTTVYGAVSRSGTGSAASITSLSFPPDLLVDKARTAGYEPSWWDRLRGPNKVVLSSKTNGQTATSDSLNAFGQTGVSIGADGGGYLNNPGATYINWFFRRAPSFFDEVCYTGTSTDPQNYSHNLQAVPEMMIVRRRNQAGNYWFVYHKNLTAGHILQLQSTASSASDTSIFTTTAPTASVFTVGGDSGVNSSAGTYVAYLFATCAGVSKVGSYTGTGTTKQVDCGFTGGARFVLIKRTDSTGDWYVWDTARGIVAGNDPYLLLNSTAAETTTTDYIDTYSAGFEISSTAPAAINASGGTFIFLAIA